MTKTLLAVSAHPDDIEFAAGGTMFKLGEAGYKIFLIVATNGENGFKIGHKPRKERIILRYNEQMNAAKLLGVRKVFFLHFRDGYLKKEDSLRDKISIIIKKVKPQIVFSFDPANHMFESINLNHHDHRAISEAVFDAVFAARNRYMLPGESHAVEQFYFYGAEKPNHYENITKYIDKQINLIKQHRSQYYDKKSLEKWVKEHLSSYTKKYKYSERFRIVKIMQPFKGLK